MTHKFDIQGHEGYVTVGFFASGRPGELFITMAKEGSTIGGLMDVVGTLDLDGLQYGVPLEVFVNKFAHSRFEPAGFTKNPDIPIAKSITDYIFRWLGIEFIPGYREANTPQARGRGSAQAGRPAGEGQRPPRRDNRPTWSTPRPSRPSTSQGPWRSTRSTASKSSSPTSRATPPPATTAAP